MCRPHYNRKRRAGQMEPLPTFEERFWTKVDKSRNCWEWTASKLQSGYGQIGKGGRGNGNLLAHRVSYELRVGAIPAGMFVDHICHNKSCVRPEHLRLATQKQNQENIRGPQSNSQSGVLGVSWAKRDQRWVAKVCHNGKRITVGSFKTIQEAEAAAIAKRLELFTHNDLDRAA